MRQGSFKAVRLAGCRVVFLLVMVSLTAFSAFGDEFTVDFMSLILENFNGGTTHEWTFGGRVHSHEFEWVLDASKFATKRDNDSYPKLTYVDSWPMQVHGNNKGKLDLKSLGVHGKFDRRGYNWVDVYPAVVGSGGDGEDPEPFEIPIPGRIRYLDVWVWGSNLNYYMEAYFRDHQGVVYALPMGNLAHQGWKNMRAQIPTSIPQAKRVLPRFAGLTFVKFRIWTTPMERVDNFYVYFNQMKVLTDVFESLYDGEELADPERVQELWNQE